MKEKKNDRPFFRYSIEELKKIVDLMKTDTLATEISNELQNRKRSKARQLETELKTAPYLEQYNNFKTQFPDSLVFIQLGDFYEAYGEDAIKITEHPDVKAVSGESYNLGRSRIANMPMTGVPISNPDHLLEQLGDLGLIYIVVSQTAERSLNGLLHREIDQELTNRYQNIETNENQSLESKISKEHLRIISSPIGKEDAIVVNKSTHVIIDSDGPQTILITPKGKEYRKIIELTDIVEISHSDLTPEQQGKIDAYRSELDRNDIECQEIDKFFEESGQQIESGLAHSVLRIPDRFRFGKYPSSKDIKKSER